MILPRTVEGSEVYLMLGIKKTILDPVLLRVLPFGVGVYLIPFTDIYGSRIIFAGPHKFFTQGNYKGVNQFCHGIFDIMEECEEEKTLSVSVPYSINVDRDTVIEIYPTPITENDIRNIGGEIEVISGRQSIIKQLVWKLTIVVSIKQQYPFLR